MFLTAMCLSTEDLTSISENNINYIKHYLLNDKTIFHGLDFLGSR